MRGVVHRLVGVEDAERVQIQTGGAIRIRNKVIAVAIGLTMKTHEVPINWRCRVS